MDYFVAWVLVFFAFVAGGFVGNQAPPPNFQCTQSQIIDGKAECVEYRRVEK